MVDAAPGRRRGVAAPRSAPHVARRVHRVGQRAVRHRRRLLHVRLLPPRRGTADARSRPTVCRTSPNVSCDRRRTTRGRASSTTWASSRPSASGAASTAAPRTRRRGSCGATSRSPTPRSTRADRTRRSPRRRYATPTPVSARCSRRSSAPECSTTTAFVLVADHGMQQTDPASPATGTSVLRDAGIPLPRRGLRVHLPG